MTKLDFMMMNLNSELEAGRAGENELYDNENLLRAYNCAVYDLHNWVGSREAVPALRARRDAFHAEILLRMKGGVQ